MTEVTTKSNGVPKAAVAVSGSQISFELRKVAYRYPSAQTHTNGWTLRAEKARLTSGRAISLRGGNMSGKTTLLKLISGTAPVASRRFPCGTMIVGGAEIPLPATAHEARLAGVATVHQLDGMFPRLSIWENVLLGCPGRTPSGRQAVADAQQLTSEALQALGANASEPLSRLSGGGVGLVRLLRATAWSWSTLLLDEPTVNLDAQNRTRLFALLGGIIDESKIVFFVSHSDEDHNSFKNVAGARGLVHEEWRMEKGTLTAPVEQTP